MTVVLLGGRFEADVDSRLGQAVAIEFGRRFVDDAHEADRQEAARDGGDFGLVGKGGDRIDDLPPAVGL
jgi:hypothetical protein